MSYLSRSGYHQKSDYGSGSEIELPFLPPTASSRSKKPSDAEDRVLLDKTDTAYNPRYEHLSITNSSFKLQTWLDNWNAWKYVRLTLKLDDSDGETHPARGWRTAVIVAAVVTGFVLLVNTVFAVVTLVKFDTVDGVGTIYEGDCALVKRWDTAIHLCINVLGTVLLAASSFTMQVLSSPTRAELEKAHAKRKSLDIGLASFKNLFHMAGRKGFLWLCLCLSTLPLHLLWNSTIFTTSGTNAFTYLVVDGSFLTGASYQAPNGTDGPCTGYSWPSARMISSIYDGYRANNYTRLTASACLNAYNVDLLTARRNLIIVTTPSTAMNMSYCGYQGRHWDGSSSVIALDTEIRPGVLWIAKTLSIPKQNVTIAYLQQQIRDKGTWYLGSPTPQTDYPVDYCLSETKAVSACQLQYVSYVLYVVVACNLIKVLSMSAVAYSLCDQKQPILATIGDGVASFLDKPDETTKGWCLLDHAELGSWRERKAPSVRDLTYERPAKTRLFRATSKTRWWTTMILCTLYLILGFVLFALSFQLGSGSLSEDMKVKFGAVDGGMILGLQGESGGGLIIDILVANSFQLALSTTYFLYNSLYTAQCAALEWASYIQGKRKSLRVTWPRGQQRSTYYLQLPYRYGIPLTLLLVLMHFLISQSIFLARLEYYDGLGQRLPNYSFSDVGFSPSATITTCSIGFAMILAQVLHACRSLDNRIPIHGNCSAVVSAMCHIQSNDNGSNELRRYSSSGAEQEADANSIATKPLTWGVTKQPDDNIGSWARSDDEIAAAAGHCSFSADMVELPQKGKNYR